MTLFELYHTGIETLKKAGIAEADSDAWILLESVTGISRAIYYADFKQKVSREREDEYLRTIGLRSARIPVQHITGVQEFMGMEFQVNEHVLIPRQDTETLVELALEELQPGMKILDMCTGSGCILISLLQHGSKKGVNVRESLGVDISEEALLVARQNAKKHSVEVPFLQSDLFDRVNGYFDRIVSNPPYIRTAEIERLEEEVKGYDPYLALDGKEDGLYFYREIIAKSTKHLEDQGRLYLEIGYDQGAEVAAMLEENGFTEVVVKKDLTGLDRAAAGVYNRARK